jgi:hypothetical protein
MAFDPDAYLKEEPKQSSFDPDAYIKKSDAEKIPAGGPTVPLKGELAGEPKFLEKATMAATAVPALGLGSQLLKAGTVGTKAAPYFARAAEMFTPSSLGGLTAATGGAGLTGAIGEGLRYTSEKMGATPKQQQMVELGSDVGLGALGYGASKLVGKGAKTLRDVIGAASSKPSREATTALRGEAVTEAQAAQKALEAEAKMKASGKTPEVESQRAISDVRFKTRQQAEQKAKQAKANEDVSLNQLSARPVRDEDLGNLIQSKGSKNIENIKTATEREAITNIKDPAFERARGRAAKGDFPENNPEAKELLDKAVADIEQQIADTPAQFRGPLEQRKNILFGEEIPLTQGELRVEQLKASIDPTYKPRETKYQPLSLQQLEFLRRWAKDPILRKDTGFGSLDATRLAKTSDLIRGAQIKYEPDVERYINTYRAGKEAENIALGGKRGESITSEVEATRDTPIFTGKPQEAVNFYLDGTANSADKLIRLVGGKSDDLVNAIKGNFREKLTNMNAKQATDFRDKNKGFFQAFPELRPLVDKVVQSKVDSERLTKMSGLSSERLKEALGTELTTKQRVATTAAEPLKISEKLNNKLVEMRNSTGKDSVKISKDIIDDLFANKLIGEDQYQNLLNKTREAYKLYGDTEQARKQVAYITGSALIPVIGVTGYYKAKAMLGF